MLTRPDFESAVKDALRYYTRTDLLAENPLLRSRLMERRGSGTASAEELRTMLAETAETLFSNARDQKVYRVLDLTYLNPAPKQEAAADRLGLPFSTYRRHLTAGISRIADWLWRQEQEVLEAESPEPASVANGTVVPFTRPRLSLVVRPFINLSQDPGEDYLVDGIVDSLITDLSRALPGSFVISRSTAFTYKNRQIGSRQIGLELRVRYVLEGSVLAASDRVRVNVQLIDTEMDRLVWAERFDKEHKDILHVQDEIVGRLSRCAGIQLIREEAVRTTSANGQGDAIDLVMRAQAVLHRPTTKETLIEARTLFEQALRFEPRNAAALAGIGTTLLLEVLNGHYRTGRAERLARAEAIVAEALAIDPNQIAALGSHAALLRARGAFQQAITASGAVLAFNPGDPWSYKEIGLSWLYLGEVNEAIAWFEKADRIGPRDPSRGIWLSALGRAQIFLGRYDDAVRTLRSAVAANTKEPRSHAFLAAACALDGRPEEAAWALRQCLRFRPDLTINELNHAWPVPLQATSPRYLEYHQRLVCGLREAGMPEGLEDALG